MEVMPVQHYSDPSFPTRSILDERPELLRLVPKRWQRNPAVITALAAVAAIMSSTHCAADTAGSKKPAEIDIQNRVPLMGDVIAVPVIPSEEDARQVICEEAKKAGIAFRRDVLTVSVPDPTKASAPSFKLLMDGTDEQHKISYEYVSQADMEAWQKTAEGRRLAPNVFGLNPFALNYALSNAQPKGHYRAFTASAYPQYDAVYDAKGQIDEKATDAKYKAAERKANAAALQDLRKQVREFIKWLKAEGVI